MALEHQRNGHPAAFSRAWRRVFHLLAGSSVPTLAFFAPRAVVLPLLAGIAGALVLAEALRLRQPSLNGLALRRLRLLLKPRESRPPTGSTYLAASFCITYAAFSAPVAILAMYYTSVGDPAASFVGERLGRTRIGRKTLEGAVGGIAAALSIASIMVGVGLEIRPWIAIVGAVTAMLAELMPLEDNLAMPLAAAGVMGLLNTFV